MRHEEGPSIGPILAARVPFKDLLAERGPRPGSASRSSMIYVLLLASRAALDPAASASSGFRGQAIGAVRRPASLPTMPAAASRHLCAAVPFPTHTPVVGRRSATVALSHRLLSPLEDGLERLDAQRITKARRLESTNAKHLEPRIRSLFGTDLLKRGVGLRGSQLFCNRHLSPPFVLSVFSRFRDFHCSCQPR
jgi:hypothetical protein